jgi:hypothetical protein
MKDIYEAPLAETSRDFETVDSCGFNCNWGFGVGIAIVALPAPGPT